MRLWLYTIAFASVIGTAGTALAAAPTFEELDQDNDGKLSKAEASKVAKIDFAKADKDQDGTLDRSEYEAAIG